MLKKIVGLALAMMLGISALTGCGADGGQQNTGDADGKIKLEYWYPNSETWGGTTTEELIAEFNASQDDIEVTGRYVQEGYLGMMKTLQTEVAGGTRPDVIQMGWQYLEYFSENFPYVSPNGIIDEQAAEDQDLLTQRYTEKTIALATNLKGDLVGLPYSLSTALLYVNTDILSAAGVDPAGMKTWTDVAAAAKTIMDKTGKYGFYMDESAYTWPIQQMIESNGTKLIEDGKAAFATEKGFQAYQLYADMVVKDQSTLHIGYDEGISSFLAGDVGILFNSVGASRSYQDKASFPFTAVPVPGWEGEETVAPAGGSFLSILSDTPEKQKAAWEFLKFLTSPSSIAKWSAEIGYVPSTQDSVAESAELKQLMAEDQFINLGYQQLSELVPWASWPGAHGMEAERLMIDMKDEILADKETAKDIMTRVQEQVNQLLEK